MLYPFLILFRPKSKSPFVKNVWLGIYHCGSHSLQCCHFFSKAHTLSLGQNFWILYYFAQTSPQAICIRLWCVFEIRHLSCSSFFLFFLSCVFSATATKQLGISKQQSEDISLRSKRKLDCKKDKNYYDCQALGTNITLFLVASIITDILDSNHTLKGI